MKPLLILLFILPACGQPKFIDGSCIKDTNGSIYKITYVNARYYNLKKYTSNCQEYCYKWIDAPDPTTIEINPIQIYGYSSSCFNNQPAIEIKENTEDSYSNVACPPLDCT